MRKFPASLFLRFPAFLFSPSLLLTVSPFPSSLVPCPMSLAPFNDACRSGVSREHKFAPYGAPTKTIAISEWRLANGEKDFDRRAYLLMHRKFSGDRAPTRPKFFGSAGTLPSRKNHSPFATRHSLPFSVRQEPHPPISVHNFSAFPFHRFSVSPFLRFPPFLVLCPTANGSN